MKLAILIVVLAVQHVCAMDRSGYAQISDRPPAQETPAWQQIIDQCVATVQALNARTPLSEDPDLDRTLYKVEVTDGTMQGLLYRLMFKVRWRRERTSADAVLDAFTEGILRLESPRAPWSVLCEDDVLYFSCPLDHTFEIPALEDDLRVVIATFKKGWQAKYNKIADPGLVRLVHNKSVARHFTIDMPDLEAILVGCIAKKFNCNDVTPVLTGGNEYSAVLVGQSALARFQEVFDFDIK